MDSNIEVRVIDPLDHGEAFNTLTNEAFVRTGFCEPGADMLSPVDYSGQSTVLGAFKGDTLVGTSSFAVEGIHPIPVLAHFEDAKELLQAKVGDCGNIASVWRFAVNEDCHDREHIAQSIVMQTVRSMHEAEIDYVLYPVKRHHAAYYIKKLGAKSLQTKYISFVGGIITAVLLCMNVEEAARRIYHKV